MAGFSLKPSSHHNSRSITLPVRSHPSTLKIEEQLTRFRSFETLSPSPNKTNVSTGLSSLVELYRCIEDLLNLPLTQQALRQHHQEKWVKELLEESLTYLDICSNTRDIISLLKASVCELQSALRRRRTNEELSIQSDVGAYIGSLKKLKEEGTKSLMSLKQLDNFSTSPLLNLDQHLIAVMRVLREASLTSNSVFRLLLLYLSAPVLQPKTNKWLLVSKLVHKRMHSHEAFGENSNELEQVGAALSNLLANILSRNGAEESIQSARQKLKALETSTEYFEKELELLFRHLINTRQIHEERQMLANGTIWPAGEQLADCNGSGRRRDLTTLG
ncbi:hypothetical protein Ancab_003102 [Ancistrocladus abbreviatus]